MASSKRVRAMTADEQLHFHILDPKDPPRIEVLEGKSGRATRVVTPGRHFEMRSDQLFWELWARCSDVMLFKRGESIPFLDFHAPLLTFEDKSLVMFEWTPEYERHKQHLKVLRREQLLSQAQDELTDLLFQVERKKTQIESLRQRLEKAQSS